MPNYRIPVYRKILKIRRPFDVIFEQIKRRNTFDFEFKPEPTVEQDLVPVEPYHEQIGIEPGSRILFFAGCYGDWAHQLAQHNRVHYTDISKSMVDYARKRFEGKGIEKFSKSDALRWPTKKDRYDYVVSFEPTPVISRLPLIVLRALAYGKGIRIIGAGIRDKLIRQYDPNGGRQTAEIRIKYREKEHDRPGLWDGIQKTLKGFTI
ncbi:class I SAM-dependent methyltransferase [Candidatus Micrarchaeota archaeon]|nr:class I SAM-dependent methyltransferase [Candidatus Micrarchaeota archaeon]